MDAQSNAQQNSSRNITWQRQQHGVARIDRSIRNGLQWGGWELTCGHAHAKRADKLFGCKIIESAGRPGSFVVGPWSAACTIATCLISKLHHINRNRAAVRVHLSVQRRRRRRWWWLLRRWMHPTHLHPLCSIRDTFIRIYTKTWKLVINILDTLSSGISRVS